MTIKQLQNKGIKFLLVAKQQKIPAEKDWQKTNNYQSDDTKLINHINTSGNYGVLCGNGLIVIDDDTGELSEILKNNNFPETLTVKTSKGYHYYFYCFGFDQKKVLKNKEVHLGEIQSKGSFVVGPNSTHPTGVKYEVHKDVKIAEIENSFIEEKLSKYYSVEKIDKKIILEGTTTGLRNESMFKLTCSFKAKKLTAEETYATLLAINKNNNPPLSDSEITSIIKSAYKYPDNPPPSNKNKEGKEIITIQLPSTNRSNRDFFEELSQELKGSEKIFYKPNETKLVEIVDYFDVLLNKEINAFCEIKARRLINLIENKLQTHIVKLTEDGFTKYKKSPGKELIEVFIESDQLRQNLKIVNRFFTFPLLFKKDNKLVLSKKGYDERLQAYFTKDCPEVKYMDITEAKNIILDILSDFCFKEEIDRTMAISYLLTPGCRGLYSRITARTPIYLIQANRERSGKDYLAGVVGMIYEGRAIDDTPINSGDGQSNNEELRKKFTTALRQGRRRIHSANNKGKINNAVLESFSTSEVWRDRELGKNKEITLDNEVDLSLSANVGLTYTPDFWYRCRRINLFFAEEDPNARKYKREDLHDYVYKNRGKILSAIYSLINDWFINGAKKHEEIVFASFPEWANTVGNIMLYHDLGNPCQKIISDDIGGDVETKDMKRLFEVIKNINANSSEGDKKKYKISDLREIISENQREEGFFSRLDFEKRGDQTKMGILIQKFIGRELTGIKLVCEDISQRSGRRFFLFQNVKSGNLGNLGGLTPTHLSKIAKNVIEGSKGIEGHQVTKPFNVENEIIKNINGTSSQTQSFAVLSVVYDEKIIEKMLKEGILMEIKPDILKVV